MLSLLLRIWQTCMQIASRLSTLAGAVEEIRQGNRAIQQDLGIVLESLRALQQRVSELVDLLEPGPAVKLVFIAELDGQISYGVTMVNLSDVQKVKLSIQPVDAKGNPAAVDGAPVWLSSNTEVLTVEAAEDGLSAIATAVGPLGACIVSVKADADLGEGVTELVGAVDVSVGGSAAVKIDITAGEPESQVTEAPKSKKK